MTIYKTLFVRSVTILVQHALIIHLVLHATQIYLENLTPQPSYVLVRRVTLMMMLKMFFARAVIILVSLV
jgi:hypothetical protein